MKESINNKWESDILGNILSLIRNGVNCTQTKQGKYKISRIETIAKGVVDPARVGYANLSEKDRHKYLINKGDILFSHINSPPHVGKSAIFETDLQLYHGINLLLLKPNEKVTPNFLKYHLDYLYITKYWESVCKQSVNQASVNQQDIKKVKIRYPKSLEEQKRIVSILDDVFSNAERAKEIAKISHKKSKNVFESVLSMSFTNPSREWERAPLNEHVKFIDYRGKTPKKTETGLRLITAKNVKMGYLQREPEEFVNPSIYDKWMVRGIPKIGDVLFTTEAPLANVTQLDTSDKVVFAQRIIVLQPDTNIITQDFLKYLLLSKPIQKEIHMRGTGATVKGIKASLLKEIEIYFPKDIAKQNEITSKLDDIYHDSLNKADIYEKKILSIEKLKQSVLNKAFRGEL